MPPLADHCGTGDTEDTEGNRFGVDEVIAAADEHGLAMVFTGLRHFRH
ncbi:MAG: hypothetical protein OXC10_07440 [Rhodospirillaceae bacterium]|nr:hypothetical protein [Rhodospirillaceae bacterium]